MVPVSSQAVPRSKSSTLKVFCLRKNLLTSVISSSPRADGFIVLATSGILLLFNFKSYDDKEKSYKKIPISISIFIGGILGFISGVVGIGGGIFLSPILFLIRAAKPAHIVTAASLFILINSVSGLIGQLTKKTLLIEAQNYWYLFAVVLVGGLIGNFLNLKIFSTRILALITAILVIFVACRVGFKILLY